jgi:hypothetical protein
VRIVPVRMLMIPVCTRKGIRDLSGGPIINPCFDRNIITVLLINMVKVRRIKMITVLINTILVGNPVFFS